MSGSKAAKSLPKRVSNTRSKERRAASWRRTQERKKARQDKQDAAQRRNDKLRAEGKPTPWEASKLRAFGRREAARFGPSKMEVVNDGA